MLRVSNIMQLLRAEQFSLVVDRILSNGRCRSRAVRQMLREASFAETAATGLALQRVLELTYGPTAEADDLVHRLLRSQAADGLFGHATGDIDGSRLAGAAVALRGLTAWLQQPRLNRQPPSCMAKEAIERAITALKESWRINRSAGSHATPDGEIDTPTTTVTAWAIALWQLGDIAEFRQSLPVDELLAMVDHAAPELLEEELSHYAHAVAA